MVLSAVVIASLALWIVLWAFGLSGFVAFLIALANILPAIAVQVARSGVSSED